MQKSARVAGWRCFQGDFLSVSLPRPEGLGYSLFALRAIGTRTKNVQTALRGLKPMGCSVFRRGGCKMSKLLRELQAAPLPELAGG